MVATWNVAASGAYYARGSGILSRSQGAGWGLVCAGWRSWSRRCGNGPGEGICSPVWGRGADGQALISNAGGKADAKENNLGQALLSPI
jgi:hypothetical protein